MENPLNYTRTEEMKNLLKEIIDESIKEKKSSIKQSSENLTKFYELFNSKIKEKCSKQLELFEKLGSIENDNGQISIKSKGDDLKATKEAFESLQECSKGIKEYSEDIVRTGMENLKVVLQTSNYCYVDCEKPYVDQKVDAEKLKNCYRECNKHIAYVDRALMELIDLKINSYSEILKKQTFH